jgi:nucleoside-diphosphate-sugar epimerase
MRIVITGGAGFLGGRLARAILERGTLTDARGNAHAVRELVLVDVIAPSAGRAAAQPPAWGGYASDPRVRSVVGSLDDKATVDAAITPDTDSVFHLAAVVSGQAEADFDIGMRVNLDAMRNVLERCRACATAPKFVFASSLAVFGGTLPDPVPDDAPLMPQSSYGTQKAIGELLVSDMSRKGFIDGRSLRLPTIVVRPGKPNKAASSFASGIIREPLAGVVAHCPVAPTTRMWVSSPRAVIDNLIIGHEVPAAQLARSRSINVPGISVAVGDMVNALRAVAGDDVADRVRWDYDPVIDRNVSTWPAAFGADAGRALGMRADASFEGIVRAHIADSVPT